jgi:hypothetical protein
LFARVAGQPALCTGSRLIRVVTVTT